METGPICINFITSQERGEQFEQRFAADAKATGATAIKMPQLAGYDYLLIQEGQPHIVECKAVDGNRLRLRNFTRREQLVAEEIHTAGGHYIIAFPLYGQIGCIKWSEIRARIMKGLSVVLDNPCSDRFFRQRDTVMESLQRRQWI